jgi:hypothetical protein
LAAAPGASRDYKAENKMIIRLANAGKIQL